MEEHSNGFLGRIFVDLYSHGAEIVNILVSARAPPKVTAIDGPLARGDRLHDHPML